MEYQMTFVTGQRRHWVFFTRASTAACIWQALNKGHATDIEVLKNANYPERLTPKIMTIAELEREPI